MCIQLYTPLRSHFRHCKSYLRNERTARMLHSALERQSGVQSYVFGDLTENFRRRELCANAAARRLVLDKHCPRVLSCAGCGESILQVILHSL